MPKIPTNHISSDPTLDYIHTTSCNFVDSNGRTLLLRGVNLSGSSKAPVTQPSQKHEGFWETAEKGGTSFVGRPLNLDDGSADEHLARLKGWGFTMLRFPVTWEALEHEGPGRYDYDFMDYIVRVLRKCKEYGFKVFMDPHQDVWSRFTGGSGAPFWTLAACGINPAGLTPTLSSIIHSEWPSVESPDPAHIPAMIWGTNYSRLASMTLFTFFFAGREYAPKCILDGKNIQDWLQSHYIAAFGELADRIVAASDLADSCVIGWDSMNEPHHGMVGIENLVKPVSEGTSQLKKGPTPTPIQSLCLGMGKAQILDDWDFGAFGPVKTGKVTIDPKGVRLWASGVDEEDGVNKRWGWRRDPGWQLGSCPWAQHGVWEPASGQVLRPAYFACTDFIDQFWRPHFIAWAKRMRQAQPQAILFVAPPVFARPPQLEEDVLQGRACLSAHYYDGLTLVTRHWNWFNADALGVLRGRYSHPAFGVKIGEAAIRKSLREQLAELKADATILGNYPTIIGEIGIPYDMDGKRAYGYTDDGRYKGDYSAHQTALDASLNACDGPSALNYTVWTYCPDSTHEWGDGWNMEDLSLWSADDARVKSPALHRGSGSVIKTPSITVVKAAAESSVSVASSRALGASPGSWRNMYDFLTDGARAVKAFSRPYPMATVGIPSSIDFDINNAEFRLEVRVRAEDASPPPNLLGSPTPSAISANLADDPSFSSKPTEIFLPLVHFVHSSLLNQADVLDTGLSGPPITPQLSESSTTLLSGSGMDVLALDVTVSAGRWDVDGQVLRWWYPVPAGDEEGEVTYNITVRRAGGAIKEMDTGSLQACAEWCGASGNGCLLM